MTDHLLRATEEVLDRWFLGVIILNTEHKPVFMNKAANDILSRGDGLRVHRRDGLLTACPAETTELGALVRRAILGAGRRLRSSGVMHVTRPSTGPPLVAFVTSLFLEGISEKDSTCAIFVSDPQVRAETDLGLLRNLYGLTAAEAKVAALLAQGDDAGGISKKLAVSFNTARTHVKRVFEKTNTGRQSELVHLILCAPLSSRLKG